MYIFLYLGKKDHEGSKGTYSVKHPRSRNSEKSSFEVPSDENAKNPEDDEEIKFDLADISIELEQEPTCKSIFVLLLYVFHNSLLFF